MEKKKNCGCGCKNLRLLLRDFCVQQFPFIAEDFDALTTYEILQKVICYLKEIGAATVEMQGIVQELLNWFDNLDVQDEIDNKLDQMFEDGQLTEIIEKWFDDLKRLVYVNAWGAVGDGVTDDTAAIQTAINENPDSIFIFHGDYLISDTIEAYNQTLELGGSEFYWSGGSDKAMFKIGNVSGEGKATIRGGRISGKNTLDYAVDVMGIHSLVDGLYTVDIKKSHIRIGYKEKNVSSQSMISNCTFQNDKELAKHPWATGGTDINNAVGIEINNNDNQIVNCNFLNNKIAVVVYRAGNQFSNCHFTAGFTQSKFFNIYPCTCVKITVPTYNTWYFNTFSNCYFDNWETLFELDVPQEDKETSARCRIELIGGTYFNPGTYIDTASGINYAYISKGNCPITIEGFSQTGSPRVCLKDPYIYNCRTRLYQELSSCNITPYAREYIHNDLVDMAGDCSLLCDNKFIFTDLDGDSAGIAPGKMAELGIVCAYNFSSYNQLSGALFEINDRNVANGLYKIICNSNGELSVKTIWEDDTSEQFCIGVYGVSQGNIGGLPFVYYKVGFVADGNTPIQSHFTSLKISPVTSNKMHAYLYTRVRGNIIDIPQDIVKLRS